MDLREVDYVEERRVSLVSCSRVGVEEWNWNWGEEMDEWREGV